MKYIFKMIIFCCLLFGVLGMLSRITTPSLNLAEHRIEYKSSLYTISGIDDMPSDSLDVLFIGSSHIYSAVSPMELWNEYGIAGYDCTSSSQFPWTSYYYLKEALKRQTPKVVVVDMLGIFTGSEPDELSNRSALDYMPLSINKIKLSYVIWKHQKGGEDFFSYLLPVLRFHSRWNELNETDMVLKEPYDYTRGYDIRYGNERHVDLTDADYPFLTQKKTDNVGDYCVETAEYYKKMVELCNSKGIKLVFIKTPISGYSLEMGNAMKKVADECDADFIDFNNLEMWDKMGYDYNTDILDAAHLNYTGACKFTYLMGDILHNEYGLNGHQGEDNYAFWDDDYNIYCEQVKINEITRTNTIDQLYSSVMNENYKLIYSGDDSGNKDMLEKLSVKSKNNNIWTVVWDGKKLTRKYGDKVTGKLDDVPYVIDGSGIYIEGNNYAVNRTGINYVIYDDIIDKIIDRGCIDENGNISR